MMALADVIGDRSAAVRESAPDRARLWSYRERHPEAAGFLGARSNSTRLGVRPPELAGGCAAGV